MASSAFLQNGRPITIAPAPMRAPTGNDAQNGPSPDTTAKFTCQTCARRKVKCDKTLPICASCRKGKLECYYEAPPPRKRKRQPGEENEEKIARYEQILQEHNLLPQSSNSSPSIGLADSLQGSTQGKLGGVSRPGKLVAGDGKSRYIDSSLWRNLGEDEMQRIEEDDEDEDHEASVGAGPLPADPVTGALLGTTRDLLNYHPSYQDALKLWRLHIRNVEPLCKVLHIPSVAKMVEVVAQQPAFASKTDECLLFAIYHFAIVSISDDECARTFGQSRAVLQARYHGAVRQAMVNAGLLKTTEIPLLQAFILFLLSSRHILDAQTFWILTGVAVRIAQRMGLHRDGEALGLSPYDVQMRRRLFFQLLPLDGMSGQMSGTGITVPFDSWDTKQPLNVSDDQIWPGMTEWPEVQKGATEMIFCLTRTELGALFAYKALLPRGAGFMFKEIDEVDKLIEELENSIETKYLRYCDIVNPLHLLVMGLARASTNSSRLRVRLMRSREKTLSTTERRHLYNLARKVIDTDCTAYGQQYLQRFRWHIKAFFQWDSFIFILTTLKQGDVLSPPEVDELWETLEQLWTNHEEIMEMKRALHIAVGRLTLKAWNANPPSTAQAGLEPFFISRLKTIRKVVGSRNDAKSTLGDGGFAAAQASADPSPSSDIDAMFSGIDGMGMGMQPDVSIDSDDWVFWDQLIKDCQPLMGQQQEGLP